MKLSHSNTAHFIIAALATFSVSAQAVTSINLANYTNISSYALDLTAGAVSGLEGSAITYAQDRGTLFWVGDEGTGVVEMSLTGQTLGSMAFSWAGTASTNHDTEGITYIGNGQLVVGEERLYDAYSFAYSAGGTAILANNYVSISNTVVGNNGFEGLSYDQRDGSFVTIKQQAPQDIRSGNLTFSATGGTSSMLEPTLPAGQMFNPALLGVTTLSDVQTLSSFDALSGSSAADNLLVLSLGSKKLLEVNRLGQIMSSLDLTAAALAGGNTVLADILTRNALEGVTIDQNGTIYLIAEQDQLAGAPVGAKSQLIVLTSTAPVPEPESYAMLLTGLGLMGAVARRKNKNT
jgi:uncharacterized protein YjiK